MKWPLALLIQTSFITLILTSQISESIQHGLIILCIIAHSWLAELLPLSITALLVPVLAVAFNVMDLKEALLSFAHPIIFLFLGGFALAATLHEHKIDKHFAHIIMLKAKNNGLMICLMLFSLTAFLSMWISNTATAVMMLPIALGLVSHLEYEKHKTVFAFLLLGIAYSANIGGIATIVGTPPNAIAASALGLSFYDWLIIALPISLFLLPLMWGILYAYLKPNLTLFKSDTSEAKPFIWNPQRILVIIIFIITASLWISGSFIQSVFGKIADFDSWIAIIAIVALHASKSLSWKAFESNTQWGVLLLFGGGLALSAVLSATGANLFLAQQLEMLSAGLGLYWLLLLVILFIIFMTEISSNTALSALMIPTFMGMAEVMGFDKTMIVSAIAVAASCAFILPVATPPNAIVFSSGYVAQNIMMKVGLILNLIFSVIITSYMFWF
ncbi:MAG: sodium-dependent dicarboxylate transporter 2/3/5 [Oleispira sp.]|jgi:sodium-dependent dicarboxylate transporter 2/3/5